VPASSQGGIDDSLSWPGCEQFHHLVAEDRLVSKAQGLSKGPLIVARASAASRNTSNAP